MDLPTTEDGAIGSWYMSYQIENAKFVISDLKPLKTYLEEKIVLKIFGDLLLGINRKFFNRSFRDERISEKFLKINTHFTLFIL